MVGYKRRKLQYYYVPNVAENQQMLRERESLGIHKVVGTMGLILETLQMSSYAFYPSVYWFTGFGNELFRWMKVFTLEVPDSWFYVSFWTCFCICILTVLVVVVYQIIKRSQGFTHSDPVNIYSGQNMIAYFLMEVFLVYVAVLY